MKKCSVITSAMHAIKFNNKTIIKRSISFLSIFIGVSGQSEPSAPVGGCRIFNRMRCSCKTKKESPQSDQYRQRYDHLSIACAYLTLIFDQSLLAFRAKASHRRRRAGTESLTGRSVDIKQKNNHLNRINIDEGICVLVMVGDNLRRHCVDEGWGERCGANQRHRGGMKSEETAMRREVKGVLLCSREGVHCHSGRKLSYVRVCARCVLYPAGMGLYPPGIEGGTAGVQ